MVLQKENSLALIIKKIEEDHFLNGIINLLTICRILLVSENASHSLSTLRNCKAISDESKKNLIFFGIHLLKQSPNKPCLLRQG